MPTTYYLSTINSDLTGSGASKLLARPGAGGAAATINVVNGRSATFNTAPGFPGTAGQTGDFMVKLPVSDQSGSPVVRLVRLDATGSPKTAVTKSIPSGTGTKTIDFASADLGAWASGDRLRIIVVANSPASVTLSLGAGDAPEQQVIAPWTIVSGASMIGTPGAHALVGSAAALVRTASMAGDAVAYTLSGQGAGLQASGSLAQPGSYVLTGTPTNEPALTRENVRDTVAAALVGGANITITADDAADTITVGTSALNAEQVLDRMAASLVGGAGISVAHNDAADTITISANNPGLTAEDVRDTIGATLVGGSGITVSPSDSADTITISAPFNAEAARDTIAQALVAGPNVTIARDDAGDTITIASTGSSAASNTFYVDAYCDGTVAGNSAGMANLAAAVRAAGGGIIEFGAAKTYVVGVQTHTPSGPWAYSFSELLHLHGCSRGIVIRGNGSKVRFANGLRFGTFSQSTGQPYSPSMPYWGNDLAFPAYAMIRLENNSGPVHVENLELDGNQAGFIIGGTYGDTGYQAPGDGLYFKNNTGGMHVENVLCHHFPRDGCQIGDEVAHNTPRLNGLFVNVEFENNCRQGVSMVGGRGYTFIGCKFNYTGRGTQIVSAPSAGIDMEQELGVIKDMTFQNCEFVNNYGAGILTVGDCRDIRVQQCSLASEGWNFYLSGAARVIFDQCTIVGSGTNGGVSSVAPYATKFLDCLFTDAPDLMPAGMSSANFASKYCPDLGGGSENILFQRCRWEMVGSGGLPYSYSNTIYRDCSFKNTSGPSMTLGRFEGVNHAEGPIHVDGAIFVGKFTHGSNTYRERATAYGPVSLASGGAAGLIIDSSFAEVGDYVAVSYSHDIFGLILHAYIYDRHKIFVRFQNDTGGTINLPAGTVHTKVISKHA